MKKLNYLLFIVLITFSTTLSSQVGINNDSPNATLEVTGMPNDPSVLDGIIIPRLTGDQLTAKTYTANQTGAIIFVSSPATNLTGQVANVTSIGLYVFDGSVWQNLQDTGGAGGTDTSIYNTNGFLTENRVVNLNGNTLNLSGGITTISTLQLPGVPGSGNLLQVNTSTGAISRTSSQNVVSQVLDNTPLVFTTVPATYTLPSSTNSDVLWFAFGDSNFNLPVPTLSQVNEGKKLDIIASGGTVTFTGIGGPTYRNGLQLASIPQGHRITVIAVNAFGGRAWYVTAKDFTP